MKISRRDALVGALFSGSMIGLRSLLTGLPVKLLLDPKKALADPTPCAGDPNKAQFVIFCTSGQGDPFSCNAPGTYDDPTTQNDLSSLVHPDATLYPYMAPTHVQIGGRTYTAAGVWSQLGPYFDRTSLCHIMTNTPVHPKEPEVLELMGATQASEMLPSLLSKQLATCLSTLQVQPLSVGATSPSEALTFAGQALPTIPPTALAATLAGQKSKANAGVNSLQSLRDSTLNDMYQWYKDSSQTTPAQRAYIDSLVVSQAQVRGIKQDLIATLSGITSNDSDGQITAAIALILMGIAPVIVVHFPFGGDNHSDSQGFKNEATQHQSGMAAIVKLLQQLGANGLADKVSFVTLNVFGRTMAANNTLGRQHNQFHQLSMMIGKPFKGGVIGGVGAVDQNGNIVSVTSSKLFDFGALPFDATTGVAQPNGGTGGTILQPVDQLASWGKTILTAVGASTDQVNAAVTSSSARVIQAALV